MSENPIINSGRRPIRPGKEYDKYFPRPDKRDRVIIEDGEVDDTVHLMETSFLFSFFSKNSKK